jgi:hypothetical protein
MSHAWSDLGGEQDTADVGSASAASISGLLQVEIGKRVRVSPSCAAHPRSASAGEESVSVALGQGQTDQPWRPERGGPDPFPAETPVPRDAFINREPSRPEGVEVVVAVAIQNGPGRY